MEFWIYALKTGRVTGALVQCPKLCQYISQIAENDCESLYGVIHFQQFVEENPSRQCTVSTIVEKFRVHRGSVSEDRNETSR